MAEVFSGLFGNDETKSRIAHALQNGKLAHAFIVKGPSGSGKHTLTREIAAAVNCENRENATFPFPCHTCRTCRRIANGQFTDYKILRKPSDKAGIGVAEIRAFREDMFLSPGESDAKIYVIENADTMTTQAQNALLKILEEPPGRLYIFLLCESEDNILVTVKSRAQHIAMEIFEPDTLARYIEKMSVRAVSLKNRSAEDYYALLTSSNGAIGKALSALEPSCIESESQKRNEVKNFIGVCAPSKSFAEIYTVVSKLPTKRSDLAEIFAEALRAIADCIAFKTGERPVRQFYASDAELESVAGKFKMKRLLALFNTVKDAADAGGKNANVTLVLTKLIKDIYKL